MKRTKIKGPNKQGKRDYDGEPNFYTMPPVMRPGAAPATQGAVAAPGANGTATGAPPQLQLYPLPPYGYVPPGYGYPPLPPNHAAHHAYSTTVQAQSASPTRGAASSSGQQQQPQSMYPYPPFYGYPAWMPPPQPPGSSYSSSPIRSSAPPTPASQATETPTTGGEDVSPTKSEAQETQSV